MEDVYSKIIFDIKGNAYLIKVKRTNIREHLAGIFKLVRGMNGEICQDESVGICLLEKMTPDTIEAMYEISSEFRGIGLGSKIVEFSKKFAKSLGLKQVFLRRINRFVEFDGINIDANLLLYLKHNFKLLPKSQQPNENYPSMVCDVEEEGSETKKSNTVLNNMTHAYLEIGIKWKKINNNIKRRREQEDPFFIFLKKYFVTVKKRL